MSSPLNKIALNEFGLEYNQLGQNEQEWCRSERIKQLDIQEYLKSQNNE